uniref:Ig-like domain-containing protein n=1 Tax=Mola mola TaxID=94237 RepID=A0A3Q3WSF7_MOLML
MSQTVLFIKLLLVHCAAKNRAETYANCREDVQLKCPHVDTDAESFLSVTWYKLHNQKKHGIIRRNKGNEETHYYDFHRLASFGENNSLLLPDVTPKDSGNYECAVNANVGGKNLNHRVNVIINVCVTKADLMTITNTLNTTQSFLYHAEDLPVMWSIIGCVAVGLTKIIISLISIWVIRAVRIRSSRRRQHNW